MADRTFDDTLATGLLTVAFVGLEFLILKGAGWKYRTQAAAITTLFATAGALVVQDKRISGPLAISAGVGTLLTFHSFYARNVADEILRASMEPYRNIGMEDVEDLHIDQLPSLVRTDRLRRHLLQRD